MGVEYDLVSDRAKVGYQLGKGPWGMEEFLAACRSPQPAEAIFKFLLDDGEIKAPKSYLNSLR